jgi:hypothetical protein
MVDAGLTRRRFMATALGAAAATSLLARVGHASTVTQLENAKPGTSTWQLTNPAVNHEIEGYASLTSVDRSGQIQLFVNTRDATYTMDVFRMGWYGGAGARQVAGPITRSGIRQVIPTPGSAGLIECDWIDPYVLTVPNNVSDPTDWASGIYLVKLTGTPSGKQSYIIFVVRDDARASDLLFQSSVTTFQAYNGWGGKSLYFANSPSGGARVVSFNRPYDASYGGGGAGELFVANFNKSGWEYNMLRWLEREGYDVTYATDVDTHEQADLLLSHKAFLSVGHDEYWTWPMRDHVEAARDQGVHLAFFGSNVSYWQVRLQPSAVTGTPSRTMVGYKAAAGNDPFARDGIASNDRYITTHWRDAPVSRPESSMVGVGWVYNPVNSDIVISNAAHWVFADTGLQNGDRLRGLLGYEVDAVFAGSPAGIVRLARSTFTTPSSGAITADMTIYTAPSGALVFATGSNQWAWGLDDYNVPQRRTSRLNLAAQQITRNLMTRFLASAPPSSPLAVAFANPTDGSSVSGTATVTVAASHGSGDGYSYQVTLDGATIFSGTNGTFSWNTTTATNAPHTLGVTATDSAGGTATASIGVTVANGEALTASFSSPAAGATVSGTTTVTVAASDGSGGGYSYQVTLDGATIFSGTSGTFSWNTTTATNAPHTLGVTATDSAGGTATASIGVTVANAAAATFTASFTYPAAGATVRRVQSVGTSTTAPWGTTKTFVLAIDGALLLSRTITGTTLWIQWDTTVIANGPRTLTLTVTDASGASATATRAVTVAN